MVPTLSFSRFVVLLALHVAGGTPFLNLNRNLMCDNAKKVELTTPHFQKTIFRLCSDQFFVFKNPVFRSISAFKIANFVILIYRTVSQLHHAGEGGHPGCAAGGAAQADGHATADFLEKATVMLEAGQTTCQGVALCCMVFLACEG